MGQDWDREKDRPGTGMRLHAEVSTSVRRFFPAAPGGCEERKKAILAACPRLSTSLLLVTNMLSSSADVYRWIINHEIMLVFNSVSIGHYAIQRRVSGPKRRLREEQGGCEGRASLSTRQGHPDLTDWDSSLPLIQLMRLFTLRTAGWTQTNSTAEE